MDCLESEEAATPLHVALAGITLAASGGAAASRCGADKLHRPTPLLTYPFAAVSERTKNILDVKAKILDVNAIMSKKKTLGQRLFLLDLEEEML